MFFIAPGKASALSGVFYGVEFESKKKSCIFFLYFPLLFVPLTTSKVLSFESKKEKSCFFFLYFPHLFVPLQAKIRNTEKTETFFSYPLEWWKLF